MPEQGADYKIIVVIHNNVLPFPSFQQACEDDGGTFILGRVTILLQIIRGTKF